MTSASLLTVAVFVVALTASAFGFWPVAGAHAQQ